jgi:uncharacterized LabA/DUF88 family protein
VASLQQLHGPHLAADRWATLRNPMPQPFPASTPTNARVMMFIDGENLAIRYRELLGDREPVNHVKFVRDVYVWSRYASRMDGPHHYIRRHYYTSTQGDAVTLEQVAEALIEMGIEAPRVFQKPKGKRAKRVDITLATEMLTHAHRHNFDVAVLVAGDEDYVPLVEAVTREGRQVALWFVNSGLSAALRRSADHFFDLGDILFRPSSPAFEMIYG